VSARLALYDRSALLVGQAVLAETGAENVILFGSRARGDYREDSDIDLLLIQSDPLCFDPENNKARERFDRIAVSKASSIYGIPVIVQLVWYSREEFQRFRRSHNHVTAIASREGINMDGGPASEQFPDEGDYTEEWSVTLDRCYHARTHLQGLTALVQSGQPDLLLGQQAQQSLEHAIKGLISANGRQYRHLHDLVELERDMHRADPGFSYRLSSPLESLSKYAGGDIYRRGREDNPLGDSNTLLQNVQEDVRQIFQRITELTDSDPCQDRP
jgi:HEPN domain-containing protein